MLRPNDTTAMITACVRNDAMRFQPIGLDEQITEAMNQNFATGQAIKALAMLHEIPAQIPVAHLTTAQRQQLHAAMTALTALAEEKPAMFQGKADEEVSRKNAEREAIDAHADALASVSASYEVGQ